MARFSGFLLALGLASALAAGPGSATAKADVQYVTPPLTELGCYTNSNATDRATFSGTPPLTNGICASACWLSGFRFAATKNGDECDCGNQLPDTLATTCTVACSGAAGQESCGGRLASNVSRIQACSDATGAARLPSLVIRLTFGRSIPTGGVVDDTEWASFLTNVVYPNIVGGSIVDANGVYQRTPELSKVLTILVPWLALTPPGTAAHNATEAADLIVGTYNKTYDQDSVLREETYTCATFDNQRIR